MALTVACDIHPLNNLRVLKYLTGTLAVDDGAKDQWYRHWVVEGLTALEALAAPRAGAFLYGDAPTLADICLIPQLYNARRFAVPITDFPTLRRIDETASAHPAFAAAHPDRQESP
jgi:maleylacetoacetate isomerase